RPNGRRNQKSFRNSLLSKKFLNEKLTYMAQNTENKATNFRWSICVLLFFATTINYLDRQVLSLTWKDYLQPEFHWDNNDYGNITALFSIFYAGSMLFAGKFIDFMDTKKGFLWAIFIWSIGAILHAFCGIRSEEHTSELQSRENLV